MDVKAGSLTVTQSGSSVIASVTTATVNDGSGRKVVIVKTNGTIGYMNPNMTAYPVFSFNFALISDPAITLTQFNDTSLFFVGLNDSDPSQLTTVYRGNAINEPIDFNNNTVIDKVVTEADVYLNTITVMATPDMRITAGIGLDENSASTYNPDTGAEIVPLANGIDAKYVLDILSTMPDEAGTFRAYIPVPHTGKNYGTEFQLGAFTWNMALKGAPTMSSPNYTAEYTSANIESRSDAEVAPYKTVDQMSAGDWANVTMIRVTNINPIQPNANDRIVFTYTVDDASDPTVVQKLNIFRPVFFVESSVVSGWLEGSYAAAALTSGEISGFVWEDTSRNGILDGTEAKFPGVVVRLRLPSAGTGSNYGSISGLPTGSDADGNYAEVTTDASGNYTFPLIPAGISYDVQFVNPDDALWWFTTQHAGNDATIDSDADPATGIANNINPTNLATARYISAGLRRIRYTVTFDKNDGDTDAIPTTKPVTRPSDKVDSLPSPPTKACHTFVGWFSTPAPTGGSQFTENTPVNEDLLVYARFAEKQFTVTFDGNGADTPANPDSKTVMCTVGHVDALPAQPAKDCHTFVGWFDTSAPTGGIQFTDASAVSGDKTVYARFTEDQFTIAFDGNGGDTPPSFTSKTVNCTDPYVDPLPLPPSKACHDFIGWFTTSAQTGGSAFTAATPVTASLTRVYARYSLIQYTVTFNSNGADTPANPGSKTVTCPATTVGTLPAPPVKTDYTFLGWFDTCDQTGGTQFTAASQVTAEMTVCARYRLTTFIVDFDKNGGDTEASPNQKPVTYPADTVGMMPSPPSKACHTFIGWFSTSNPTGGSQFTAITPVSAHTRVYARYSIIQYTVTFDKNGGDTEAVPPAKVVTCPNVTVDALPVPPGKACHTFVGWFSTSNPTGGSQFTAASAVYADKTVYARYALKQYTVSFNSNGGYTEADPRQKTIICPAATVDALPTPPVRPCHTFAGWFDTPDKTGGTQFTEASAVAEDKIVYARFQEIQYTVSFHSNGGDTQPDPPSKTVMCTYGRLGTLPMPPSRDCYQFAGWFNTNAETGGSQYGAASIVNADRDLYARWRRITHTITYSKGQATAGSPPESETVNCGDNYSPAAGAGTLERFGYTFDGWSATNGGEAASNIADVRANQTLYPVWKAVDNTLSFALESGNAVIEHVHVGDFVNLDDRIEQPSKEGYTLLGYSTDPDAKKPLVRSQFVLTPSLLQQMLASTQPGARDFIIILYPIFLLNTHTEMRSHMNTAVGNWANTLANEAEVCYWDIIEMFDMKIDLRVVPDIDPGDLP
ncbi:MAG: InlB B-repeat-containing protein, partial [Oscillospiraceae bacterium]|jgi:uncharacterized repeat protein (TIGR02543 family)|nr:InlB B-repeat-containing protein [Oscillospiraceae bacterium]